MPAKLSPALQRLSESHARLKELEADTVAARTARDEALRAALAGGESWDDVEALGIPRSTIAKARKRK